MRSKGEAKGRGQIGSKWGDQRGRKPKGEAKGEDKMGG